MKNATQTRPIGSDPVLAFRLIKRLATRSHPKPAATKRDWRWWRTRNIVIDPNTL